MRAETLTTIIGALMGEPVSIDDRADALTDLGFTRLAAQLDRDEWPIHQPAAPDAPLPGRHWFSGCEEGSPRVDPVTGSCESCGEAACRVCGREDCPDHAEAVA